jgi:hypothetical protein
MARLLFVLLSALFITSFSYRNIATSSFYWCSGGDEPMISRPAFLYEPQLVNTPQWSPLFLTSNYLFDESWNQDSAMVADNIREWKSYFGDNIPETDIKSVIYEADAKTLVDIQVKSKFKQTQIHPSFVYNKLVQKLIEKPDEEFINYLIFIKTCEKFVDFYDYWDGENEKAEKSKARISLAKQGEQQYRSCKSPFIKLRYGYQVVRLYHYAKDYLSCVEDYDKMVEPLKSESMVRYWALEQKAGALYKLGREGEGAFLFSKIFIECPNRKITCLQSFRIPSDTVWEDCVKYCSSQKEKATLYFLRGLNPRNSVIDEMKNIYSVDPGSDYINVLLSRCINTIESDLFHSDPMDDYYRQQKSKMDTSVIKYLCDFIDLCVAQKKVQKEDAWLLAYSYIRFLDNDELNARVALARLKRTVQLANIKEAIPRFEAYYNLASSKLIDDEMEDILFKDVEKVNYKKLQNYAIQQFYRHYLDKRDTIKAFLCVSGLNDLKMHLDMNLTDEVIKWLNKKKRTSFDQFLADTRFSHQDFAENLDYYYYPYYDMQGASGLNGLLEIKGTIYLGQNNLKDAYNVLKPIPEEEQWQSRADPFSARIRDCRDCDFNISADTYSHLALVGKIIEYEQKIISDPKHAARYHYLLGNAYYNISYFGNSAEALTFSRNCDRSNFYQEYRHLGKIPFDLDCSRAQAHYVEGMKLAEASKDYELAAECCFMAAKCEQNAYYVTVYDDNKHTIKNTKFRTYFRLMREKFSNTGFYSNALRECKYFNYFVSK